MDIYHQNFVEESNVICVPIPIFHIFGLVCGIVEPLICGGKAVFPHLLPDTLAMLKAIQSEKCTAIKGFYFF
jgi:fatty-acyl-CoA synthase